MKEWNEMVGKKCLSSEIVTALVAANTKLPSLLYFSTCFDPKLGFNKVLEMFHEDLVHTYSRCVIVGTLCCKYPVQRHPNGVLLGYTGRWWSFSGS